MHTPGPWTLETVPTSCGICHKVGPFPWRDDKHNHACIYVDHPSHDGSAPRDQELLANARLIAAAPDLLAVLQKYEHDGHLQSFEDRERFRAEARAAIAKATA